VAAAVMFLAAPDCGYLTGATIDLNGGWMML
jgi:NAD(P)-dependent dehydrogenase (short-subunit alcohol dehydrogenase family)